jgi:type IV pilus assembly protein PilO
MRPAATRRFGKFDALCAAGVVLVTFLAFLGVCRAQSGQLMQAMRRTNNLSAEVAEIQKLRASLDKVQERLETTREELALVHRRIPDDLDTEGFLKDLNGVAARNKVVIVGVRPGEITEQGSYRDAPVAVEATAKFHDFYSFINALRDMPRLATVEDVTVEADDDGLCQISLTLKIYAYKETDDGSQEE